jgi:hypothetical protein
MIHIIANINNGTRMVGRIATLGQPLRDAIERASRSIKIVAPQDIDARALVSMFISTSHHSPRISVYSHRTAARSRSPVVSDTRP